jgi:hypothetical protein
LGSISDFVETAGIAESPDPLETIDPDGTVGTVIELADPIEKVEVVFFFRTAEFAGTLVESIGTVKTESSHRLLT